MKSYVRTKEHRRRMSFLKRKQFFENPLIAEKISKSRIGIKPPNFGKKDILEVREKKSRSMKLAFKEGRAIPLKGILHPRWNGFDKNSYIKIYSKRFKNGYIFEHRLIMESLLGRKLKKNEVIHHINGNPKDNRLKNLRLLNSRSEHSLLHEKEKKCS